MAVQSGFLVHGLISAAVSGVEVRPPHGDLGRALFSQALLVLRGHPRVAPWLSHEGLTKYEGGLGHELVPHGAIPCQVSLFCEGLREVEMGGGIEATDRRSFLGRQRREAPGSTRA